MENVSGMFDHNVVVMTVTDTEDVGHDTVTSAACREVVHRLDTRHKQPVIVTYIPVLRYMASRFSGC